MKINFLESPTIASTEWKKLRYGFYVTMWLCGQAVECWRTFLKGSPTAQGLINLKRRESLTKTKTVRETKEERKRWRENRANEGSFATLQKTSILFGKLE
ncbi:hypothetical protein RUM44_007442 [Polyplax serrata]|uniref:Uncharacterized protein n=1 Tax=Polyplax serrata TaxID=468196 RepID=A0ABR1B0R2_POLSC